MSIFNFAKKSNNNKLQQNHDVKSVVLKIEGMHCVSCGMNIDMDLEDLAGVSSSNTNFAKAETKVVFNQKKTTLGTIEKAIENLHYKVIGVLE